MRESPLSLSVCLLDPDPTAVAILVAAFAPVSSDILATVPPLGEEGRCRCVAADTAPETAVTVQALTDQAQHPWVLVVPPGLRPTPGVIPWLLRHLDDLQTGTYIGLGASSVPDDSLRPWLIAGRRRWSEGPPVRPAGEQGEDVPVTLLTALHFAAAPLLSEGNQVGERELIDHMAGLRGVLELFPHSVRAHYELAECLRLASRHLEACDLLYRAWNEPAIRDAWVPGALPNLLARLASDVGLPHEAETFARLAIAHQPGDLMAWELLVRLRFEQDGAAAAVVETHGWWQACLTGSPAALRMIAEQPVVIAEAARHLVWALTAAGQVNEARVISALGEAPPDLPVHVALQSGLLDAALDLLVSHQPDSAVVRRRWDRMVSQHRDTPDMLRGMIWSSLSSDYYRQLALQAFGRAIDAHPDRVDGYWRRARILAMRASDLVAARSDLYRALRIEPRSEPYWRTLANVCRMLGDEPGAQAAFREANRLAAKPLGR